MTAIFTLNQTASLFKLLNRETDIILSVFAGRIADTGINAQSEMKKHLLSSVVEPRIIWDPCQWYSRRIDTSCSKTCKAPT